MGKQSTIISMEWLVMVANAPFDWGCSGGHFLQKEMRYHSHTHSLSNTIITLSLLVLCLWWMSMYV